MHHECGQMWLAQLVSSNEHALMRCVLNIVSVVSWLSGVLIYTDYHITTALLLC